MSFFDRFRKAKGPLTLTGGQPENFYLAVQKFKDRPGVRVSYKHKKQSGEMGVHIETLPMADTLEIADNVADFIGSKWGGGQWQITIIDANNKHLAIYNMGIGGTMYNQRTGRKMQPDDPTTDLMGGYAVRAAATKTTAQEEMLSRIMEKVLTADPFDKLTQLVAAMQSMNGGPSAMEEMMPQLFTVMFNNGIAEKESRVDELKSTLELAQMLTPKVAPEDPMTAIASAIPGLASAYMMMKSGGGGGGPGNVPITSPMALPQAPTNGGINMGALKGAAMAMPPAMISQLPPDQQAAIMQLRQTPQAPPGSAVLPRPGSAQPGSKPSNLAEPVGGADTGLQTAPPSPYHAAIDGMIEEIRADLRAGASDEDVASKMISMATYARGFGAGQAPHPLLGNLLAATDESGNEEFAKLCNQIPELAGDLEHIQRLGAAILEHMKQGMAETAESLDEEEDDAGPGEATEFLYETEAEKTLAEEKSNADVDVSTPTGISNTEPEPGATATEPKSGSGEEREDPADSEQIREIA